MLRITKHINLKVTEEELKIVNDMKDALGVNRKKLIYDLLRKEYERLLTEGVLINE